MKKLMMTPLFLLLGISFSFSQSTYPKIDDPANVVSYKLKNGLTVVLSENHDRPTVMGAVIVKAGSKNDPASATGIAHYLEHMLFKGTIDLGTTNFRAESVYLNKIDTLYQQLGQTKDEAARKAIQKEINQASLKAGQYAIPNELDQLLAEIGSTGVNAFTSNDVTAYHNEFPSNKMTEWLDIYSHRFVHPVFRLFQSELEAVYEEKNRGEESFFQPVYETFMKNFFKKHPYGTQTTIGTTEHLKNPSLMKMYDFYNKYYVANNMILCLVGDFDTKTVIPQIEHFFSGWRTGEVPTFPNYQEEDFKKGESVTVRLTPIKAFVRGYRTPKLGTYDASALEMASNILTNDQGSGLFDEVVNQGKIMELEPMAYPQFDYGATLIIGVPKILGQSFEKANAIIDTAIQKLITGNFSDELFEGAKNEWIKAFETDLESNDERALKIGEVYASNGDWRKYMLDVARLKNITKAELVAIAKKYFSKNYFTLYSKMGHYKPEKLEKPGYDPILPKNDSIHSEYFNAFNKKYSNDEGNITPLISLKDKIVFGDLPNGIEVKAVKNPINEVFNLDFVWEEGIRQHPDWKILVEYLDKASTADQKLTDFKNQLYALGTSYYWSVDDNTLALHVEGLDPNFEKSMELLSKMVNAPVISDFPMQSSVIAKKVRAERRLDINEPQSMARILNEYALYGDSSRFLMQPSSKEFKWKQEDFNRVYQSLEEARVHINYSGNTSNDILLKALNTFQLKNGTKTSNDDVVKYLPNTTNVYFINHKKSVQSHLFFLGTSRPLSHDEMLSRAGFNLYFGTGMYSVLFQEVREFRSLAYSTYGFINNGRTANDPAVFRSYIGCQSDKTPESLHLLDSLIKKMPIKQSRSQLIHSALFNLIASSNPGFRHYTDLFERSKRMGFDDNYYLAYQKQLKDFSFDKMVSFYQQHIQPIPLRLTVVGNGKAFNPEVLKQYGTVKTVKIKHIYKL